MASIFSMLEKRLDLAVPMGIETGPVTSNISTAASSLGIGWPTRCGPLMY
jgi:hypothetical protein